MGSFSIWHWLIVALVILVLFGRGKISEMMGDFGKGISSFKKGMSETEDAVKNEPAKQIPPPAAPPVEGTVVTGPPETVTPEKDDSAA